MSQPFTLYNFLREHDQAIQDWLRGLLVDYGTVYGRDMSKEPILQTMASPMRAFGQMGTILVDRGWLPTPCTARLSTPETIPYDRKNQAVYERSGSRIIFSEPPENLPSDTYKVLYSSRKKPELGEWSKVSGDGPEVVVLVEINPTYNDRQEKEWETYWYSNVPLPFVSVYRGDESIDPNRQHVLATMPIRTSANTMEQHRWPSGWDIPYQLDFWAKRMFDVVYMKEWIMAQFAAPCANPSEILLPVWHGGVWGRKLTSLRFEGFSDNSDLEGFTNNQRLFRFTLSVNMKARLFHMPKYQGGRILTVRYDYDPPEIDATVIDCNLLCPKNPTETDGVKVEKVTVQDNHLNPNQPDHDAIVIRSEKDGSYLRWFLPEVHAGVISLSGFAFLKNDIRFTFSYADDLDSPAETMLSEIVIECKKFKAWHSFDRCVFLPEDVKGKVLRTSLVQGADTACILSRAAARYRDRYVGPNVWTDGDVSAENVEPGEEMQTRFATPDQSIYLFTARVLTATGKFNILLEDNPDNPGYVESATVDKDSFGTVALRARPAGADLGLVIRNVGEETGDLILTDVALRTYTAPVWGNEVF